ncbi:hypothetical protein [Microvirga subterranea]|uniref:Beta/gamma crystallin n=1 Tax=Microvirga subterranea TaxID=186651 RepID=A0A370HGJ6_9HYPH|nr:hypothetical protein [Microvirga subterranea]RDI56728.1 hypothetical protein DES45_10876 [Microvirga subterranea]
MIFDARVLGSVLIAACFSFSAAAEASDFMIEPGRRAGPVTKDMTEAQLKALLPKGQVKRVLQHVEEDVYNCGTLIYAGTDNEAFVSWASMTKDYWGDDPKNVKECEGLPGPSKPQAVTIENDFFRHPERRSSWRSAKGIRLGMNLRELETAAGQPFLFSACQCDYGGVVFGEPLQRTFPNLDLRLFYTDIPDDIRAKYVNEDDDYALKSSDVPPALARRILLWKIVARLAR